MNLLILLTLKKIMLIWSAALGVLVKTHNG